MPPPEMETLLKCERLHIKGYPLRWFLARSTGADLSGIRLPENLGELEEVFWKSVDAAISEALEGRAVSPGRKKRKRAG